MPLIPSSPTPWSRPGCTAETFSRELCTTSVAIVSGTLYVSKLPVQAVNLNNAVSRVAGTVKAGGTHGWMVVLDDSGNVVNTTADQTDAASTWITPGGEQSLPFLMPYQQYLNQLKSWYFGLCIVATTMPTIVGGPPISNSNSDLPFITGTAGTGLTTPPVIGSKLAFAANGNQVWGYTT